MDETQIQPPPPQEAASPSNVTDLAQARGKQRKGGRRPKGEAGARAAEQKPRLVDLYRAVADAIGRRAHSPLPPFPVRFLVLELEPGVRLPLLHDEADDVVTHVKLKAVAYEILRYCETLAGSFPEIALGPNHAKEATEYWLATAEAVAKDDIKFLRWQGEPGLTYQRLPWAFRPGAHPTWNALLARMSNMEAFCHWLGSLFFEESSLQNYVWLYGGGGDGKGAINRFLERVFGNAYRSKQPQSKNQRDKFWAFGLLGARLVVFPDCDDPTFVTSGLFKSLTGGDPLDLEAKQEMSFTARLGAKYLVISNERPALSGSRADKRRIIYCELEAPKEYERNFEDRLWAEGGAFLEECIAAYREAYPDHGPLKPDMTEIDGWVSSLEERLSEAFERHFDKVEEGACGFVTPGEMSRVLELEWPGRRARQTEFRKWLEQTHGILKKYTLVDHQTKQREWRYNGIIKK